MARLTQPSSFGRTTLQRYFGLLLPSAETLQTTGGFSARRSSRPSQFEPHQVPGSRPTSRHVPTSSEARQRPRGLRRDSRHRRRRACARTPAWIRRARPESLRKGFSAAPPSEGQDHRNCRGLRRTAGAAGELNIWAFAHPESPMISPPLHGSAGSTIATPGHRQRTAGINLRSAYPAACAHLSGPPCARHVDWVAFASRPSPPEAILGTLGRHRHWDLTNTGSLVCTPRWLPTPRGS